MSKNKIAAVLEKAAKQAAEIGRNAAANSAKKTTASAAKQNDALSSKANQGENKRTKIDAASILKQIKSQSGRKSEEPSIVKNTVAKTKKTKLNVSAPITSQNRHSPKPGSAKTPAANKTSYLPVGNFRISSSFGVDRGDHRHSGIDLAVPEGTAVSAAENGTVAYAGWSSGYGYRVVIDHGDGTETTYNHLSDIGVEKGDKVKAGSQIALSGNTGNSTGPHLHFEVIVNGEYVNPENYFDFGNGMVALADNDYASKVASAAGNRSSSSTSSSPASSANSASHRLTLPSLDVKQKFDDSVDESTVQSLLPETQTNQFSRRAKEQVDYFDQATNPLLLLVPAYNYDHKKGRTSRTQTTKQA